METNGKCLENYDTVPNTLPPPEYVFEKLSALLDAEIYEIDDNKAVLYVPPIQPQESRPQGSEEGVTIPDAYLDVYIEGRVVDIQGDILREIDIKENEGLKELARTGYIFRIHDY